MKILFSKNAKMIEDILKCFNSRNAPPGASTVGWSPGSDDGRLKKNNKEGNTNDKYDN